MWPFSGIINTYKKSEAAVVVQKLLEIQANAGLFDKDCGAYAGVLVDAIWSAKPAIFNGSFGQRPFKLTVAATALANGLSHISGHTSQVRSDTSTRDALVLSLGNIFLEIETNGQLYPLNSLDHQLLESAMATYIEISEEVTNTSGAEEIIEAVSVAKQNENAIEPKQDIDLNFEEYKKRYFEEVKRQDPDSVVEGMHWLEFADEEGTKRAYGDGVDPKKLAEIVLSSTKITDING
ncbi:hypothetical protein [Sneathiella sp. HT1-7]|uniref:hypothetical protein n=1 Tax=Sneathiella sp. HT1-7 TaxID=2887192 RepID=UPI001D145434|nr:hypothetical protein [Sneathiella sp. HT1-7]MCC3306047.1 hypothetical protein [Sneathiella sp. HT1-7]